MRVAVSNLAWHPSEEATLRGELSRRGVRAVEIAPTKVWQQPLSVDEREIARYRDRWETAGIRIVALQSLLFGRTDLAIFRTESEREATLAYLQGMIRLAQGLGATVLVFGSPRNRQVGQTAPELVQAIATNFFTRVAEAAFEAGVCFCLEPNPPTYGCDFITSAAEGIAWVQRIAHPGLGLHLDSGCLTLSQDPLQASITSARPHLRHFHISEPGLAEIGTAAVAHDRLGRALDESGFEGWRSIEMRAPEAGPSIPGVLRALDVARAHYA